ncbi:hypothetical protein [Rhizobium leguminosarum]|uniref:hypothetical protein n=1 Tax=Rhizobium leguminosarum TaxID=384 RepID=UPI003F9AEB9D
MNTRTETPRKPRASGKDPPMRREIPQDIRDLIYEFIPDTVTRVSALQALDEHVQNLCEAGREEDCKAFLEDERKHLIASLGKQQKDKSRTRLTVVATYLVPAFVTIVTRVITDHMPFG